MNISFMIYLVCNSILVAALAPVLDVLIVDEAHRVEKKSNSQFTLAEHRTDMPQIEQLIRCAKTSVFFIDDKQSVRAREVGATALIKS